MKHIKKILVDEKGNRYFWREGDIHSPQGVLKEKEIQSGRIKSHLGKEFIVFDAAFTDQLEKIKRGPAIITQKDIGQIIAYTGIGQGTNVVDAGSGCGMLAAGMARVGAQVTSYEIRKENVDLTRENCEFLGVKVKVKEADISKGVDEKNVDVVTLDLPNPEKVLEHAEKALKSGGYCVCYIPNVTQIIRVMKEVKKREFVVEKVMETIEREWIVEGLRARPKTQMLGHTAFLVFLRRW